MQSNYTSKMGSSLNSLDLSVAKLVPVERGWATPRVGSSWTS